MTSQVVDVLLVINVVDFNLKVLTLLEMILHIKALNPLWVQVIHNDLSHAQFLPLVTNLLVKDNHAVSSCESVQIG